MLLVTDRRSLAGRLLLGAAAVLSAAGLVVGIFAKDFLVSTTAIIFLVASGVGAGMRHTQTMAARRRFKVFRIATSLVVLGSLLATAVAVSLRFSRH